MALPPVEELAEDLLFGDEAEDGLASEPESDAEPSAKAEASAHEEDGGCGVGWVQGARGL